MNTINILFCGTGGQGVLTAAEICGWAAMFDGFHVKKSEVHGMAQRGGSVESHLRFGKEVFSPLITKGACDFLVSFHRGERDRMKLFLKADGKDLIDDLCAAESALKDPRHVNTYLLGALSVHLPLTEDSWLRALEKVFSPARLTANREVFLNARKAAAGRK
jgi:indolepyruvate ferredoxin oxidoreductase beta subunit